MSPKFGFRWNVPEVVAAQAGAIAVWVGLRLHAVPELWRATGNPRFRAAFTEALRRWSPFDYPASWRQVQNLAFLTLLDPGSPLDSASRASLDRAP